MKKFIGLALVGLLSVFNIITPYSVLISNAEVISTVDQSQIAIDNKADAIVKTGISLINKATYNGSVYKPTYPYEFGCSGFISFVFLQNGIELNTRNTQFQAQLGVYVPKDQLKKGDLVFFDSNPYDSYPVTHDGIYIGDNKIIHMADTINNVIISDLNSSSYYRNYYKMARRLIPSYMPSANPTTGDKIVSLGESLLGKVHYGAPYNESTLTFGSAGFTYYLYKMNGIDLKNTYAVDQSKLGIFVPKDQLQKGDLVFFASESNPGKVFLAGIYAGNLNVIINAGPSLGAIKSFMLTDYYLKNYVTARRIL